MTTSTHPEQQWHWINECDVPVTTAEESLSVDARNLSDPATLGVQNDSNPDPTYQDCWPSARYESDGPDDNTPESAWAHMANAAPEHVDCYVSEGSREHRIGTRSLDPLTGEYVMQGDFFDGSTEMRWSDNRHDDEPVATAESCPECGTVTNIEYAALMAEGYRDPEVCPKRETVPEEETPDVPFPVQQFMFESLAEHELGKMHDLIDDNAELILELARARFRDGYKMHGSKMYAWSPERRLDETLCELADAVVYPTSGPLE